jgi:fumarate hydratase class II
VGTGVNTHPQFGARVAARIARVTGVPFVPGANHFQDLSCQDTAVEMSGQVRAAAVSLMKIANDLRWMNSGPLAGLGEIRLPALQPGSSIMPGKVNPVIPEAAAMACAQVIGHDVTIAVAGQSGSFQLNVMLPVIAYDLLSSIRLLAVASRLLADKAIAGFEVDPDRIDNALRRNPVLVTALNPIVGYDKGAEIVRRARVEGRPIVEVAAEVTGLDGKTLARLLDPEDLTRAGVRRVAPAKGGRRRRGPGSRNG